MGKKRKKRKSAKGCENCLNAIPAGDGCFVCMEGEEPQEVIDEYSPTEEYFWCGGKKYE